MTENVLHGIDLDELVHDELDKAFPEPVSGRVVHIDADFACYQSTYIKKGDHKTWEDMVHGIEMIFSNIANLAGATTRVLHVTPEGSDKGGRYAQACTKEYQGNRLEIDKDVDHKKRVHAMRDYVVSDMDAIAHFDQEADDGMARAAWYAHSVGTSNLCVIASADKDLRIPPGLHLNLSSGELEGAEDTFGYIYVDDTKSTKKVLGYGTKFFWAQMLMGDTADNIPGLHKVSRQHLIHFKPTGKVIKAKARLANEALTAKQIAAQEKVLSDVKPKACGPILAYDILKDVANDKEAVAIVRGLYKGQPEQLTHWDTAEDVTWQDTFISNAQLLWMRSTNDKDDVFRWFKEINS